MPDFVFPSPVEIGPAESAASTRTGPQFDIFKYIRGGGIGPEPAPNPFASIGNFIRSSLEATGASQKQASDITTTLRNIFSGKFTQPETIAQTKASVPNPRSFPVRTVATAAAGTAITIAGAAILTNPGVQQTIQSVSKQNVGAIQSIADAFKMVAQSGQTATDFLTKNPLVLIGGLAILGILVLKK